MKDSECIARILQFWFGELDTDGLAAPGRNKLWFQSTPADDRQIEEEFGDNVARAISGALDHWSESADGLVALILLLDQFPRSIYRGTPRAFSGDAKALLLCRAAVSAGIDSDMPSIHRVFLYIPFEHAEDLQAQDEGVACFDRLLDYSSTAAQPVISGFRDYMLAHREVIARFGRFPHRNPILERTSTTEEMSHLELHGGF
ncbi:MAG: DUF924 family protein [Halieaceae bacterium]